MALIFEFTSARSDHLAKDFSSFSQADLSASIEAAFGFDGLGILVVRGVPNFAELRGKLLPLAHRYDHTLWPSRLSSLYAQLQRISFISRFANLSEEAKNKTVHKESFYSFGWSHGQEILEGRPDYSKGMCSLGFSTESVADALSCCCCCCCCCFLAF